MPYRRSGRSGLHLPALALGIQSAPGVLSRSPTPPGLIEHAIDFGITHFDIAPLGSAEDVLYKTLSPTRSHRTELVISTRIGLGTRPGPTPGFGSRKHLLSGLDYVLQRTGLDYVDVLYAHRYDNQTPLDETAGALATAVRTGKALYVGLSDYAPSALLHASRLLQEAGTPAAAYQTSYSLFDRWADRGLLETLARHGIGAIACAPLARAALTPTHITDTAAVRELKKIAAARGQTLPQLAISWTLRTSHITSALITTTRLPHLKENLTALEHLDFTPQQLEALDRCCPSSTGM
ncbi:aldo/keto reductase [Streptomyces lavendulae]|uniref:aldo/keto reductase n=1 Tax=Streptomyces lavendulae TaxID=1914 RepID=UPI0033FA0BCD